MNTKQNNRAAGTVWANGTEAAEHVKPGDLIEVSERRATGQTEEAWVFEEGGYPLKATFSDGGWSVLYRLPCPITLVRPAPEPRIVWPTAPGSTARTDNWGGTGLTRIAAADEDGDWYVLGYGNPYSTDVLEGLGFKPVHDAGADQ